MKQETKLEEAKRLYQTANADQRYVLERLYPELKESEDEKNVKDLIDELKCSLRAANCQNEACNGGHEKRIALLEWAIAWIEKQEKPKKVSIWKHWKDGIAGNGEGKQIFLIKSGLRYSISSCLGHECDYIELSELDELLREEKQGMPKWTEKDEENFRDIIRAIHAVAYQTSEDEEARIEWLQSLKQRIVQ